MEELMNQNHEGEFLNFVLPKNQSSYIKVMGVGGGGSNAVNHMFQQGIKDVDFIICNTDAQALEASPVPNKIQLGKGLGAGNVPQVARDAAVEKHDEIKEALTGTKMLFLTAGMGGGTGTGATPVVASIAKEIELVGDEVTKILTVAIVTMPFSFEGRKRVEQARAGVSELRKIVDSILIINNDQLRQFGKMSLKEAFAKADDILTTAAKGISEIITVTSYVQIDFKDVNTVMHNSGAAIMGYGSASGENRAKEAIEAAMNSPLLNDNSIKGSKNVLLYFSYGPDAQLNMDEIDVVTKSIAQRTETEADMIWGAGEDASAGENLNITLIATGFEEKKVMGIREKTIINLNEKTYTAPAVAPAPAPIMSASTPAPAPVAEIPQTEAKEPEKKEVVGILSFDGEVSSAQVEAPSAQVSELKAAPAEAPAMTVSEPTVAEDPLIEEVKAESELWMNDIDIFANVESIATEQEVAAVEETAEVTMSEQEQSETVEVEEGFTMEIHTEAQQEMGSETMHQETVTTVMEASEQVQPTNAIRERYAATAERMMHLRQMSQKIKTQQGLREIESIPAYQRQNLDLTPVVPSDVSEVSTTSIGRDGSLFSSNPPFLTDKAD
ncbi:MAG: cell division protein FtsZ [Bacteroidales bacterium]|nr:cell division protein FtsZ [Bacteroidales bacterium]